MTPSTVAAPPATEEGLRRKLVPRQIAMMAMGSAIGVGLLLGSTVTIRLAGPGVIVTYVFGALIALVMGYALAEMAVMHPVAGSFGVFADRYLSSWAGYIVRTTYAFVQILAIGAEVTAVAIYFAFWFPAVPAWFWVVAMAATLVAINTAHVGVFGELEYWFALIKVAAILAFIVAGLVLVAGIGPWPAIGLRHLVDSPGGFLPNGWRGVWLALTLVITSYMGIEGIAVTAGEAEHPETSIPRAMRMMVLRLIIFYVLAVSVMLMMSPWRQLADSGGSITGSPFVRAFTAIGIPSAAGAMNLVVISAAVSSANANLYMTARMLLSLAQSGYAPRSLGIVSRTGVPLRAVATASAGVGAAILLAIFAPASAFLALYGTAVAGMLFIWIVILVTYVRFRAALTSDQLMRLPIRMPAHRAAASFGIVSLVAISATTFFVDGLQYSVTSYLSFLALMSFTYARARRRAARS
ncbi:MAG TPA: amino acid permease [Vicinamibacterales bacterium]|jgi:L-asparagine transporter-like permease|nr:amino acid permease [Vicinamibacterales bacterium]